VTTETLEHTARRIAEQGRDALVARLRPAFEQAAATHGEGLDLDSEQLERMVQRAADRADGLQWRRALAQVATEQLGIGLGEALGHPAVARAQAIVGAPSYEDALGDLGGAAADDGGSAAPAASEEEPASAEQPADEAEEDAPKESEQPEPAADAEPAAESGPDAEPAAEEPPPGTGEESPPAPEAREDGEPPAADTPEPLAPPAPLTADPVAAPPTAEHPQPPIPAPGAAGVGPETGGAPDALRLRAVHLGGIANLQPAEGDLELHLSDAGLDIVRGPERVPLGRLTWEEIVALETPVVGGRFRRKRQSDAHLVIRSAQGSASFEIPGVTTDELKDHLAPMIAERSDVSSGSGT
jgi:hypothetical protein